MFSSHPFFLEHLGKSLWQERERSARKQLLLKAPHLVEASPLASRWGPQRQRS